MGNNMVFDDMPHIPNYLAEDIEYQRQEEAWINRLPWLTAEERESALSTLAIPRHSASDQAYINFAVSLRRESSRVVPCIFKLDWGQLSGALNLVSGAILLTDNGSYVLGTELPSDITLQFEVENKLFTFEHVEVNDGFINTGMIEESPRSTALLTFGALLSQKARPLPAVALNRVVEAFAQAGQLPEVEISVAAQLAAKR